MSPEKLLNDPAVAPVLFGMVVKVKDFVAVKALTITVTIAFSVGIFYAQTNALIGEIATMKAEMATMRQAMISMQSSQAITNNNVSHIRDDMDSLTAQVGQMQSNLAKIRR